MNKKVIMIIVIAGMATQVTTTFAAVSGSAVFSGFKWVASSVFKSNQGTAQAGAVVIDSVDSYYKGYYAHNEVYEHKTFKSGYQDAPRSTLNGQSSTHHNLTEMDYEYYDLMVYQVDSNGNLYNPQTWIGHQYWEPTVYLNDSNYYISIGTVRKFDVHHRVFSNYSNLSGDQRLRNPGTYNVTVRYSLSDVSITPSGLAYKPQDKVKKIKVPMSAIQNDDKRVDLLPHGTKIDSPPYATGSIIRKWGWEFVQNAPPNPYVGESIGVIWTVKEKIQE